MIVLYFDGLCEPRNPGGWGCFGWLVERDGKTLAHGHGVARQPGPGSTNNVAEYEALLAGLRGLARLGLAGEPVEVCGDSQLVINQVTGRWGCNAPGLRELWEQARAQVRELGKVSFRWVPRAQNARADVLSRKAYAEARGW